jgi:hypothetical protein
LRRREKGEVREEERHREGISLGRMCLLYSMGLTAAGAGAGAAERGSE